MKRKALIFTLASFLVAGTGTVFGCEYTAGETQFIDYANCRYGTDSIVVVDLPEDSSWDNCVYQIAAFTPDKLLAVTKVENGKETHSINSRGNIGNPCYLTKKSCDAAMKAHKAANP